MNEINIIVCTKGLFYQPYYLFLPQSYKPTDIPKNPMKPSIVVWKPDAHISLETSWADSKFFGAILA